VDAKDWYYIGGMIMMGLTVIGAAYTMHIKPIKDDVNELKKGTVSEKAFDEFKTESKENYRELRARHENEVVALRAEINGMGDRIIKMYEKSQENLIKYIDAQFKAYFKE
jgi:ElaB/YqjD/DUF883 family membrane-anchored ribosome-binding protein